MHTNDQLYSFVFLGSALCCTADSYAVFYLCWNRNAGKKKKTFFVRFYCNLCAVF